VYTVKTLISLNIIEATLRNDSLYDIKASDIIITIAVNQILQVTPDKSINEIILLILHNWKVYSGQLNSEGLIAKQNQQLENIFKECFVLKNYLKNSPKTKQRKTSKRILATRTLFH
jgi:hypothetical protein